MSFQIEFVKFDEYRSISKAIECLARQFDTVDEALIEAESVLAELGGAKEAEGFRIVEAGALIVAEKKVSAAF